MTKIKIIFGYLFGFILSIVCSLTVLLVILKFSLFYPPYLKGEFDKINYSSSIYNEINEGMKDYVAPTGFPDSILDGAITEEEVKLEINNYLDAIFKGQKYEVNTSQIEGRVKSNVDAYLKKHNLKMDETEEFKEFTRDLEKVYSDEVKLYNVLDRFVLFYPKISSYIERCLMLLAVLFLILVILLIIIKSKVIGSSIMSSGIILVLLRIFILEDINIEHISLFNDYFSLIVRNVLTYISDNISFIGYCLIALGLVLSMFISKRKLNLKK